MSAVSINIQRDIENRERELLRQWVLETCFPKELKALEIITKKNVNCELIRQSKTFGDYNKSVAFGDFGIVGARHCILDKETFDLLKGVLK